MKAQAQDQNLKKLMDYINDIKKNNEKYAESYLIAVLHKAQELYGYLSQETMDAISEAMSIPTSHIWGVSTFYHHFKLIPQGKHLISVCLGTACYVKGADKILEALKKELNINVGQTTEDKLFTLQEARCLGCCGLAPVMMIDDKVYGQLNQKQAVEVIRGIKKQEGK